MPTTEFIARNGLISGNTTINGTTGVITLGNVTINVASISVGNATVNTTVGQGTLTTGAPTMNATHIVVGANCTINTTVIAANNLSLSSNATIGRLVYAATNSFGYITSASANSGLILQTNGTSNSVIIDAAGKVGVGTAPSDNFHVSGNIVASGDITTAFSDERLKEYVSDLTNVIDKLKTIKGFAYVPSATCLEFDPCQSSNIRFGVSAQKVQAVYPELVSLAPFDRAPDGTSKSGQDYLTIDYTKFVPILIEAIKELSDKYDKAQAELDALKADLYGV